MEISQSLVDQLDLQQLDDRVQNTNDRTEFFGRSGDQHYRLLAYLSTLFSGRDIIDIGTHRGSSALALSYNPHNRIHTFDIEDRRTTKWDGRDITFHRKNLWDPDVRRECRDRVLGSAMIFLDIDPHDGPMELEFYRWLKSEGYEGLLVCDDIWYFKGMRDRFWYHIPANEKTDLTLLGHWSGTGLVHFGKSVKIVPTVPTRCIEPQGKSWTVVTAYFNLTKRPDASQEIKNRPQSYYMTHANMTMALDQNLVVFCDAESRAGLERLRPTYLAHKTQWIVMEFEEFELVQKWFGRIQADRTARNYNADPRNTVSYYLFCMLRYEMLRRTIAENPFGSTHFAWCNICIERMSWKNGVIFPYVWGEFRDKFSTCYIDYQPKNLALNWPEYFRWGRCGMCSGFFTGNKDYMGAFCVAVLNKFAEVAEAGYGHADEQLFSLVFFEKPELFEFYLGDYTEMIVNYGWVRDRATEPVRNVLRNLDASGENRPLQQILCQRWLQSYTLGAFRCDTNLVLQVQKYWENCNYV